MIWPIIFSINIAQCLFLIALISIKGSRNSFASRLIILLLIILGMTNIGYLVTSSELSQKVPELILLAFGGMWIFGPVFYLYSRAIVDQDFKWKHIYWLHFIPYLYQVGLNIYLLYSLDHEFFLVFMNHFKKGLLGILLREKISIAIQIVQMSVYLVMTLLWIRKFKLKIGSAQFIVSMTERVKWLNSLAFSFWMFLVPVIFLYFMVVFRGFHDPLTNYSYTLVTSLIIFMLAYKLALSPELLSPDFAQKYRAYMQFEGDEGVQYVEKIRNLMTTKRLFTNPDLSLAILAEELKLPTHQLSKLINEKFGKSFTDLVNEYRVEEFIAKMNDPKYQNFSLYGIALDVGFNSKSTFNTAFKKITGKTPSEFREK
ncbi:MAG: helix-turn-helix domain-containing protein [Bacteroidota bacterium]